MGTSEWALILVIFALLVVIALVVVVRRRQPSHDEPSAVETKGPSRIGRSATALGSSLRRAWGAGLDDHTWQELEEALLGADVGLEATTSVVAGVRSVAPETPDEARQALATKLRAELGNKDRTLHLDGHPAVILVVG